MESVNATDEKIRSEIERVMREKRFSQVEIANRLGISRSAVNQLLSGERGTIPNSLLALLDALDLELVVREKE